MTLPVPLWAVGAALIVAGPWAVNRIAIFFTKKIEARTDAAILAMTPRHGAQMESEEESKHDAG